MNDDPQPKPAKEPRQLFSDTPICEDSTFLRWAFLGVLVLFFALAMEYMRSDLWMDELITIYEFAWQEHWRGILSQYPVANNHMLFSVLLWNWSQLNPMLTEEATRFPNLLFAVAAIGVVYWQGRKLFSKGAALLLVVILALSPLYLNFFWQLRGYGLSILLSLIATLGCFRLLRGDRWTGLAMFGVPALLLPGVLPTNVLVNGSLVAYVALVLAMRGELRQRGALLLVGAMTVMGLAGMLIYLPVRDDFVKVMQMTGGWSAGWRVAGHWLQSLAGHGVIVTLLMWGLRRRPEFADIDWHSEETPLIRSLPVLLLCCAVPMLALAFIRSPFPRALLGFLGPLTFCVLIGYRERICRINIYYLVLLLALLVNVLAFHNLTDSTMRQRLRLGEYPQNLLQQYYNRNGDVSLTAQYLHDNPLIVPNSRIFIDVRYYHSMQLYCQRQPDFRSDLQFEPLNGGEQFPLKEDLEVYPYYPQYIIAYNAEEARASYRRTLGLEVVLEPIATPTQLRIFYIAALALPRRPGAMPPGTMPPRQPFPQPPPRQPEPEPEPEPEGIPIRYVPGTER